MSLRIQTLLAIRKETGQTINRLLLVLLGVGLACTLTLGFPDSYLLSTTATVNIPLVGGASFKTLIILGPILLIAIRAYLEVYVGYWRRIDKLVKKSPSGLANRLQILSPLGHPLLRFSSELVLYGTIPLVLVAFTYKAMVFPLWGVGMLCLAVVSTIVLVCTRLPSSTSRKIIFPLLAILPVIAVATHQGAFENFRRNFQLAHVNLERAILAEQDLRSANLRGAILNNANLNEAQLQNADLNGAQLNRVTLVKARLQGASLLGAELNNASLVGTQLNGADLSGAYMRGAFLLLAQLQDASLDMAQLDRAELHEVYMQGASLVDAHLKSANMFLVRLQGADLLRAQLQGANLSDGQLQGANFESADLDGANLSGANLKGATGLTQAQLVGACGNLETQLPEGLNVDTCVNWVLPDRRGGLLQNRGK